MALYVYTDGEPKQSNGQKSLDPFIKTIIRKQMVCCFYSDNECKECWNLASDRNSGGKKRKKKGRDKKSSSSLTFESFTCFPKPKITKREKKTWLEVPKDHRKRGLKRQKRATREDREGQWQCSVTE